MPKVAYMWSDHPQMTEVAARLRREAGWEPVLWVGWDHLALPVADEFPGVPWQRIIDAWFGAPIEGLGTSHPDPVDEQFWRSVQQYMPRLMNQMSRFGPSDHFLYEEREAFARALLLRWHEALSKAAVEIAFWEESPSVPFSFAAYVACKSLGIKTLALLPTKAWGLSLLREEIDEAPLRVADEYMRLNATTDPPVIPPNVEQAMLSVTSHGSFKHRAQMTLQALEDGTIEHRRSDEPDTAPSVVDIRKFLRSAIGRMPLARSTYDLLRSGKQAKIHTKIPGRPIDSDTATYGDWRRYTAKAKRLKTRLESDYRGRCINPTFDTDTYIYFPLHYCPERTTNPDGGVFYAQILALQMISHALPEGWKVYVKEHGVQFFDTLWGECGRAPADYDLIGSLRGIQFIDVDVSSKSLVENAAAVATVTGTVCWEAALLGKPAYYFGSPWYMGCPGTIRVKSPQEISAVLENPSAFLASESELRRWHEAFASAGFHFEFNAWFREPGSLRPEDQTEGLFQALYWWHSNRFCTAETGRDGMREAE